MLSAGAAEAEPHDAAAVARAAAGGLRSREARKRNRGLDKQRAEMRLRAGRRTRTRNRIEERTSWLRKPNLALFPCACGAMKSKNRQRSNGRTNRIVAERITAKIPLRHTKIEKQSRRASDPAVFRQFREGKCFLAHAVSVCVSSVVLVKRSSNSHDGMKTRGKTRTSIPEVCASHPAGAVSGAAAYRVSRWRET